MLKFPGPPSVEELARVPAAVDVVQAGTWFWRLYFLDPPGRSGWKTFRTFGPVESGRFDHHLVPPRSQERGILYVAFDALTCLAEVFQTERTIDRARRQPWLAGMAIERELTLFDLTGTWPTIAGASMAISSGPRDRAKEWSQAIYAAYPTIDGLVYGSSMNANLPTVALYERAVDAMPPSPIFHRPLTDPALETTLILAANRFGYALV